MTARHIVLGTMLSLLLCVTSRGAGAQPINDAESVLSTLDLAGKRGRRAQSRQASAFDTSLRRLNKQLIASGSKGDLARSVSMAVSELDAARKGRSGAVSLKEVIPAARTLSRIIAEHHAGVPQAQGEFHRMASAHSPVSHHYARDVAELQKQADSDSERNLKGLLNGVNTVASATKRVGAYRFSLTGTLFNKIHTETKTELQVRSNSRGKPRLVLKRTRHYMDPVTYAPMRSSTTSVRVPTGRILGRVGSWMLRRSKLGVDLGQARQALQKARTRHRTARRLLK